MQVLLNIKDDKSEHLLNVLKDLKYVKVKTLTNGKSKIKSKCYEFSFE